MLDLIDNLHLISTMISLISVTFLSFAVCAKEGAKHPTKRAGKSTAVTAPCTVLKSTAATVPGTAPKSLAEQSSVQSKVEVSGSNGSGMASVRSEVQPAPTPIQAAPTPVRVAPTPVPTAATPVLTSATPAPNKTALAPASALKDPDNEYVENVNTDDVMEIKYLNGQAIYMKNGQIIRTSPVRSQMGAPVKVNC